MEYAQVISGQIARFVDVDPAAYAAWVAARNPKAETYRPVVTSPLPPFDPATQVAVETLTVEPTQVVRGWTVRPKTADERRKVWTAYQFLQRFTDAELVAIRARSQTDAATWKFLTLATAAQEVVSDDPVTVAGMDYLVSVGILTAARKAEILGT